MNDTVFWAAFGGGAAAGIFTFVAVIGAEWFRWYLDRPLLNVAVNLGRTYFGNLEDQPQQIFLEATNPHSRTVTVSSFGLIYSKRKFRWLRFPSQSTRLCSVRTRGTGFQERSMVADRLLSGIPGSITFSPSRDWVSNHVRWLRSGFFPRPVNITSAKYKRSPKRACRSHLMN